MPWNLFGRGLLVSSLLVAVPLVAGGQQTAATPQTLDQRMSALEAGQKALLKELQDIKALLSTRPAAPAPAQAVPGFVSTLDAPARGNADARLTMIEFSDFQCPFCGRFARQTYGQIQADYVATGKVRYLFRHTPITGIHPLAFGAAVASECARAQGKFWEMHDRLFANQQALARPALVTSAEALGLDAAAFDTCLSSDAAAKSVRRDMAEAASLGATATPTFFLAVEERDGKMRVLQKITGAKPFAAFKTALDTVLGSPAFQP